MTLSARLGARIAAVIAAALVGCCVAPLLGTTVGQEPTPDNPFRTQIDPQTPLTAVIPAAPTTAPVSQPWLVGDIALVPQVLFKKQAAAKPPLPEPKTFADQQNEIIREEQERQLAIKKLTEFMAQINRVNGKGTDRFVRLLRDNRPDIAGLPFLLGDTCRLSREHGKAFVTGVAMARDSMPREPQANDPPRDAANQATRFWAGYTMRTVWGRAKSREKKGDPDFTAARIAALMQVLGPEDKAFRIGLIKHLSAIPDKAATRALGRLAIYSFESDVRQAAIAALKIRPNADVADMLLAGVRYPWPAVAQNAGEVTVQLGRKDLVPQLVSLLDEPDPRAPAELAINGKKTVAVREVVRLNHTRSCLLCHPPANLPRGNLDADGKSQDVVAAPVPTGDQPPRSPFFGYDPSGSPPEIFVRADVTYLRQDFSLMQPVPGADAKAKKQRFDFLVRTRPVPHAAMTEYQKWLRQQGADYLAPHQRAAVAALRALTGRDAEQPTAQAWRAVLAK